MRSIRKDYQHNERAACERRSFRDSSLGGNLSLLGGGLSSFSETVLCSSCHMFQVSHSAGSLSVSALGLHGPVVYTRSSTQALTSPLLVAGVASRSASLLLSVPGLFTVHSAQRVGLVVTTTHG